MLLLQPINSWWQLCTVLWWKMSPKLKVGSQGLPEVYDGWVEGEPVAAIKAFSKYLFLLGTSLGPTGREQAQPLTLPVLSCLFSPSFVWFRCPDSEQEIAGHTQAVVLTLYF